jgi:hypothetical protein
MTVHGIQTNLTVITADSGKGGWNQMTCSKGQGGGEMRAEKYSMSHLSQCVTWLKTARFTVIVPFPQVIKRNSEQ